MTQKKKVFPIFARSLPEGEVRFNGVTYISKQSLIKQVEEMRVTDYAVDIAFEHGKPQRKGYNQALDDVLSLLNK